MYDILFTNAKIITMCDEAPLQTGCLGVKDGKITLIAPEASEKAARTIDCHGNILMPGLINTHTHIPMSLLRGYADDYELQTWLFDHILPVEGKLDSKAVSIGSRLAMAEMLKSGTTAFNDMYFFSDCVARAALEVGMRANICNPISAFGEFDFDSDRAVTEYKTLVRDLGSSKAGLINITLGIHSEYSTRPDIWERAIDLAKQNSSRIHIHLSETKAEHEGSISRYGKTPAAILNEYGVFDAPTTAAHCVWLSDEDMDILSEKGVAVAHCPISNLKLGSGIAQIYKLQAHGIIVALGTDGCASNNTHDMFEEMKTASLLQKGIASDSTRLPAYETIKLATVNGAKALGIDSGRLEIGANADIIMIDTKAMHQRPMYNPISNIVYCTRPDDVQLTMVNGKILYENGQFTTIDIDKLFYDIDKYVNPLILSENNTKNTKI